MLRTQLRAAPTARHGCIAELAAKEHFCWLQAGCAALMTQAGLAGAQADASSSSPRSRMVAARRRDLVERNFTAEAPGPAVGGRHHLHSDLGGISLPRGRCSMHSSRRIVGWSMATSLAKQLVIDALNMALVTRRPRERDPSLRPGFAVYLDRVRSPLVVMQACAHRWARSATRTTTRCAREFLPATSSASCSIGVGSRHRPKTTSAFVFESHIEGFYNPRRRHSSIVDILSPIDYERRHHAAAVNPNAPQACRRARGRQGQALWGGPQVEGRP